MGIGHERLSDGYFQTHGVAHLLDRCRVQVFASALVGDARLGRARSHSLPILTVNP
jgi:hypothetical protein